MKIKPVTLAAIAAATLGLTTATFIDTLGPAWADRPGPGAGGGSGGGSGGGYRPPSGRTARIISDTVNVSLYSAPDFDADTVGQLRTGTSVTIYDSVSGWYYVTGAGLRGWVPSGVIQF